MNTKNIYYLTEKALQLKDEKQWDNRIEIMRHHTMKLEYQRIQIQIAHEFHKGNLGRIVELQRSLSKIDKRFKELDIK